MDFQATYSKTSNKGKRNEKHIRDVFTNFNETSCPPAGKCKWSSKLNLVCKDTFSRCGWKIELLCNFCSGLMKNWTVVQHKIK